jgi:hypothetical protein
LARYFLLYLVASHCNTLILLGSQTEAKWLATETFEDNIHKLSGIDGQSAFILLKSIMTPAICENHAAMLSALQPEKARTDSQGEAKQQSLLDAAINYIYDQLAPNEQGLLLLILFVPTKDLRLNTNRGKSFCAQKLLS